MRASITVLLCLGLLNISSVSPVELKHARSSTVFLAAVVEGGGRLRIKSILLSASAHTYAISLMTCSKAAVRGSVAVTSRQSISRHNLHSMV